MTLEQVIQIIRQNGKPYLQLDFFAGPYDIRHIGSFTCANCSDNDTVETQINKAIEWLQTMVATFDDDIKFAVTIKPNPKATRESWIGPIEFYKQEKRNNQQTSFAGLTGIDPTALQQLGYVPAAQIENERLRFELRLKDKEIEDLRRRCEEEKELIKQEALNWSPERWAQLAEKGALLLGIATGKVPAEQLQGLGQINNQQQNVTPEQALALAVYKKLKTLPFDHIKAVNVFVDKLITVKNERGNHQNTTEQERQDA